MNPRITNTIIGTLRDLACMSFVVIVYGMMVWGLSLFMPVAAAGSVTLFLVLGTVLAALNWKDNKEDQS